MGTERKQSKRGEGARKLGKGKAWSGGSRERREQSTEDGAERTEERVETEKRKERGERSAD